MARAYNKNVKGRDFQVGDLVLQKKDVVKPVGKLEPPWEGPYRIVRVSINGSFELEEMNGKPVRRTWNARNLQKYYP